MNIYDFDGTIYDGDSTKDIIKYGFKKHPFMVLKCLKRARRANADFGLGLGTFEQVKEELLAFIFKMKNYPKFINDFVESHMKKIKPLYKSRHTDNDVIVTASYDLWVNLFARKIGVRNVIATRVDAGGKILGINCKGDEKLRRIKEALPNIPIENAYTDSQSDEVLLINAQNGFIIEGNKVIPYVRGYKFKKKD
jgi:HAD superfamily phosphoserine phosphatase-like hydrolase